MSDTDRDGTAQDLAKGILAERFVQAAPVEALETALSDFLEKADERSVLGRAYRLAADRVSVQLEQRRT